MNGRTLEGPNKSARGTNNTIVGPYGVAFGDSNKVTIIGTIYSICAFRPAST
jgi:hypothetical protein